MNLEEIKTHAPAEFKKDETKEKTKKILAQIEHLQRMLYAQKKYSLLVIFQGLDASGKDGAVRKIFSGINPLGCNVTPFKKPNEEEAEHDFLWRVHKHAPARGMIEIFNRSHYEDILVPTVEGYISLEEIEKRYDRINEFEQLLADNNTQVLKFYLHVSREEQKERLIERMTEREKFWKHNDSDWESRQKWDAYMAVYEKIFDRCNKVPWNIIPADQNWYKEHLVAQKILSTMENLDLKWPALEV